MSTAASVPYTVERATRASRVAAVLGAALVVLAVSLPWWGTNVAMRSVVEISCYLVFASMWNLLAGYGGLVSIGQQGFLGLGGYFLFIFAQKMGVNPFVSVPLAALVAAAISVPTAQFVFRLQGGYFAVGTWVVAEVFRLIFANVSALGGGSGTSLTAMVGIPKATREMITYWMALAIVVFAVGLVYGLLRSRFGLALTAIRDSERAAESQGIDVARVKLIVYVLAAFGAGLAGALYYLSNLRISPDVAFSVNWTAFSIFIVLIGGIGTIEGPILGALLFWLLNNYLSDYGSWYLIGLGLMAIVVIIKWPRGIWGSLSHRFGWQLFPVQRTLRLDKE
ncbi:MAG TPA: branched-chain amino acid ABC transporter permease [Burkholderiales bacterium]|nr:branched-chain amino acid ABC transporter permease [Burkholderiales bacterium]